MVICVQICRSNFAQKTSTCELCPSPLHTVRNINSNWQWDRNSVYIYICVKNIWRFHWIFKQYFTWRICGLLINIHEVMVFCGVFQHICTYWWCDDWICDAVTLDENLKLRCRDRGHFDVNNHFQYFFLILSLALKFIFIGQDNKNWPLINRSPLQLKMSK